jgi:hypothetical protein
LSPNRLRHHEQFRRPAALLPFVSDPQVGLCRAYPWQVRASDGFQVLQIVTDPGPSRLERRSLDLEEDAR